MSQLFTNNAISLLENNLSGIGLTINVIPGDGQLFPQPSQAGDFFLITLEDEHNQIREIVKIIERHGDTLIIDPNGRGFDNTNIYSWPVNTLVDHRVTAFELRKIDQVKGAVSDSTNPNIVNPNAIKDGDIFQTQYPNNLSCKWIVTVLDESSGRVSISELLAVYRGASNIPDWTVYAKTGDKLKYAIDIAAVGTTLKLNVINNDTVPLRINTIRINY